MTVKLGLLSDVHATPGPVRDALNVFRREGVDMILCAGDIAGYAEELEETIDLLIDSECRCVFGNHDLWHLETTITEAEKVVNYLTSLPVSYQTTIADKSVYMVHAHPPSAFRGGIKLLDENGRIIPERVNQWQLELKDFHSDVLIVGHTHQVFCERINNTLVINPGSSKFNHTCTVLSLPDLKCEIFPLSNKEPELVWNWGGYEVTKDK